MLQDLNTAVSRHYEGGDHSLGTPKALFSTDLFGGFFRFLRVPTLSDFSM